MPGAVQHQRRGDRAMKLVLLPGLDGTGLMSETFIRALGARGVLASCIAYPRQGPQDYDSLHRFVASQLPSTPFILLGESFAGPLAIRIASERPPAVRGLILTTTFAARPVPLPAASSALARLPCPVPPIALLATLLLGRWSSPTLRAELRDTLRAVPSRVLRERVAAALDVDVRGCLRGIEVPTLCLQARHDRLLWRVSASALRRALPRAAWQVMDGPHLLLQAQPEPGAQAVADWLGTWDP